MMKHFLRVFNYKNTSLGARSTLNSRGKYCIKLNSTGTKLTPSFDYSEGTIP